MQVETLNLLHDLAAPWCTCHSFAMEASPGRSLGQTDFLSSFSFDFIICISVIKTKVSVP